jgi:hypothetical protein
MAHNDPTFLIVDPVGDAGALAILRGWREHSGVRFDWRDATDLSAEDMTAEAYRAEIDRRIGQASAVAMLVGPTFKALRGGLRPQVEAALRSGLPIIAMNLNGNRKHDLPRLPKMLHDRCVLHVSFEQRIVQHALDQWPGEFQQASEEVRAKGPRCYEPPVYRHFYLLQA